MAWFFRFAAILLTAFTVLASGTALPAQAERRVALVIGNGAYLHAPHLPNPPELRISPYFITAATPCNLPEPTILSQSMPY
jgi:hypothetical protein